MNRVGRLNITLDPDVAEMLRRLIDRVETQQGFRPTAHQVVSGLISKAAEAA